MEDLLDLVSGFSRVPDVATHACTSRENRRRRVTAQGLLQVGESLSVDATGGREDGVAILEHVDLAPVRRLQLLGARADLLPVLARVEHLCRSPGWRVAEVAVLEAEGACLEPGAALCGCVEQLAGSRHLERLELAAAGPVYRSGLDELAVHLGASRALRRVRLRLGGNAEADVSYLVVRHLRGLGWLGSGSPGAPLRRGPWPPAPAREALQELLPLDLAAVRAIKGFQRCVAATASPGELRLLREAARAAVAAQDSCPGSAGVRRLDQELATIFCEESQAARILQRVRELRDMFVHAVDG